MKDDKFFKGARVYDSPLIKSLLDKITPEMHNRTVTRMVLSAALFDRMEHLGIHNKQMAEKLNVKEEKIEYYLSGCYNFTLKELADITFALGGEVELKWKNND